MFYKQASEAQRCPGSKSDSDRAGEALGPRHCAVWIQWVVVLKPFKCEILLWTRHSCRKRGSHGLCVHSACLKDKAQPDGCCRYAESPGNRKPILLLPAAKGCQAWQLSLFINQRALTWGSRPGSVLFERKNAEAGKGIQVKVPVVGKEGRRRIVHIRWTKQKQKSVFLLAKDAHLLRGRKHTGAGSQCHSSAEPTTSETRGRARP